MLAFRSAFFTDTFTPGMCRIADGLNCAADLALAPQPIMLALRFAFCTDAIDTPCVACCLAPAANASFPFVTEQLT